jgi:hypothetical protein
MHGKPDATAHLVPSAQPTTARTATVTPLSAVRTAWRVVHGSESLQQQKCQQQLCCHIGLSAPAPSLPHDRPPRASHPAPLQRYCATSTWCSWTSSATRPSQWRARAAAGRGALYYVVVENKRAAAPLWPDAAARAEAARSPTELNGRRRAIQSTPLRSAYLKMDLDEVELPDNHPWAVKKPVSWRAGRAVDEGKGCTSRRQVSPHTTAAAACSHFITARAPRPAR